MADFLLELFSEEIPARMQKQAMLDAEKIWGSLCTDSGIVFDTIKAYVTPRRLVVHIQGLPVETAAATEEMKGPRVGSPDAALQGFVKSLGIEVKDLTEQDTPKGKFYIALKTKPAQQVEKILTTLIGKFLTDFPWPKSMRWGSNSFRWVRPLHNIMALFNEKTVKGEFSLGTDVLTFNDTSFGHRFLAPGAIVVKNFTTYKDSLEKAHVLLETEDRKASIATQLQSIADQHQMTLKDDPALVQEMAGAAEWPQVFLGQIPVKYLTIPAEVLTAAMRTHQKYFSFTTKDGKLAPYFAAVGNNIPKDGGKVIVEGNEQILASRLFDAHFFWNQDLKAEFSDWSEKLTHITFHAKLGSVHERVARMIKASAAFAELIGADVTKAKRAAELSKIDLVSGMVGEFPELQGIMGGHYAAAKAEDADIALAIQQHYMPAGPNDACPTSKVSIAVALADKLDTLVGFFGIDQKPTGSKDPFALRRAALGVIHIILENRLSVALSEFITIASDCHAELVSASSTQIPKQVRDDRNTDLIDFFKDRLKVVLKDQGYPHDVVGAVIDQGDNLMLIALRAKALQEFLGTEQGMALLALYKRASAILKKENLDALSVNPTLFEKPEEKQLYDQLSQIEPTCQKALAQQDYVGAMMTLASLKAAIDSFFEQVTVNDQDSAKKNNRFALLKALISLIHLVADLNSIEG